MGGTGATRGAAAPAPPITRRALGLLLGAGATAAAISACTSGRAPAPPRPVPGQLLDLSRWKLTEPVAARGEREAREVLPRRLATYSDRWFRVQDGTVQYTAPARGATTSSSSGATRSELREMTRAHELAGWSLGDGQVHELTVTLRCDASRMNQRQEVVVGQVHGAGGTPPLYLAVDQSVDAAPLQAWVPDAPATVLLTGATPSAWLSYRIRAHDGGIDVWAALGDTGALLDAPSLSLPAGSVHEASGLYFKAGCYNKQKVSPGGAGRSTVHHRALTLL